MLVLESFQAGLSWECILNKRESFREAFDNFDYQKIAAYDEIKVRELLSNSKIIRNKLKINAVSNNAKVFMEIQREYQSFSNYIWSFTSRKVIYNKTGDLIASNPLSDKISLDLKRRGMKFVGTTIIYSYLQAIGVIFDHETICDMFEK